MVSVIKSIHISGLKLYQKNLVNNFSFMRALKDLL